VPLAAGIFEMLLALPDRQLSFGPGLVAVLLLLGDVIGQSSNGLWRASETELQ